MNYRMNHAHSPIQGAKFKGLSFLCQIGPEGNRVKGTIPELGTRLTQLLNK